MIPKGTMRPFKKILGGALVAAGLSLVLIPEKITPILCDNKMIFGLLLALAGYFLFISGRRL